jgi:hypothetical protein
MDCGDSDVTTAIVISGGKVVRHILLIVRVSGNLMLVSCVVVGGKMLKIHPAKVDG